jgi:uncharacterized membrane protein YdjX (TVP38/TMEM64 family)
MNNGKESHPNKQPLLVTTNGDPMKEKKDNSKWLQIGMLVLILAIFGLATWYYFTLYDRFNVDNLNSFISGFGVWAPVAFFLIYLISSPIPFIAPVISAVGGLLFGALPGTLLSMVAATTSAFIPFYLARSLGREWVEKRIKNEKLQEAYEKSEGKGGFLFVLLMRLIPLLPWEVQNYVAGLTKVKIPVFIFGTLLGIIPGTFSLAFLGDAIQDPTSWEFFAALGLKIVTALVPAVYLFIKNRLKKKREAQENEQEAADEMAQ